MVCSLACYLACCCLGCSLASWIPCRPVGAGWLPVWSLGDLSSGCVASWLAFWLPSCLPCWLASLLAWAACWYCGLLILVGARAHACIGGSAQSCAEARNPLEFDKRLSCRYRGVGAAVWPENHAVCRPGALARLSSWMVPPVLTVKSGSASNFFLTASCSHS